MRLRSASKVVDEMEHLQNLGVNVITFEDDDFTVVEAHVLSICREICERRLNIKWICHARIDEVTPQLLIAMKEAGCSLLLFGIESGSQRVVDLMIKSFSKVNWRKKANETFFNAKNIGIATCAMFMVGNPTETKRDLQESISLSLELKPDMIKVHNFTLYPGALDYDRFRKRDDDLHSQHHYLKPHVNVSQLNDVELKKAQLRFYRKFLFRPSFIVSHLRKYLLYYLVNWPMSWNLIKEGMLFLSLNGLKDIFQNDKSSQTKFPPIKKEHQTHTFASDSYSKA